MLEGGRAEGGGPHLQRVVHFVAYCHLSWSSFSGQIFRVHQSEEREWEDYLPDQI